MNELQVFNFENQNIREVTIDGEPWFVGKDIAEALGYSNTRKAISDHVHEDDKGVTKWDTLGGKQNLTIINESGLYALIFGSKLDSAKRFKRWVTSEVLPTLRKTGAYTQGEQVSELQKIREKTEYIRELNNLIDHFNGNIQAVYEFLGIERRNTPPTEKSSKTIDLNGDSIREWISDRNVTHHTLSVSPTTTLYDDYCMYCAEINVRGVGKRVLYNAIREIFDCTIKQRGDGYRYFTTNNFTQ